MQSTCSLSVVIFSVVDPHHFDADLDPTFHHDAYLDTNSFRKRLKLQIDADPAYHFDCGSILIFI
jgi:hypothetical protein